MKLSSFLLTFSILLFFSYSHSSFCSSSLSYAVSNFSNCSLSTSYIYCLPIFIEVVLYILRLLLCIPSLVLTPTSSSHWCFSYPSSSSFSPSFRSLFLLSLSSHYPILRPLIHSFRSFFLPPFLPIFPSSAPSVSSSLSLLSFLLLHISFLFH